MPQSFTIDSALLTWLVEVHKKRSGIQDHRKEESTHAIQNSCIAEEEQKAGVGLYTPVSTP